jgi:hypothetical protein
MKRVEQCKCPLTSLIQEEQFLQDIKTPIQKDGGSTVIAAMDSGEPAVVYNRYGCSGRTIFVSFNISNAYTEKCAQMVHDFLWWFRSESGVKSKKDPLAIKRAQWIKWRSEHITDFVRDVNKVVKAKDPNLAVSIAGEFAGGDYHLVFRESKKWLDENLLDFGIPMDYRDDLKDFRRRLQSHFAVATEEQMKTIYPGLSVYTKKWVDGKSTILSKDAKILEGELQITYDMGFLGYTIFATSYLSEEQIKVLAEVVP